mgnify:CR=1 FL=1
MRNICLITGAAGLLGKMHAEAILEMGKNLCITDIDLKKLKVLCTYLKKRFPKKEIIYARLDVTNEKQIKKLYTKLSKNYFVSVLINNAAIDYKIKKGKKSSLKNNFYEFNLKRWNREIQVGLTGYFLMIKIFGKKMVLNRYGRIINVASDLSVIAPDHRIYNNKNLKFFKPITYSVIKHAILGLSKYYSSLEAEKNILCNSVSFGGIKNNQPKEFIKKINKIIPMKRMANINEYKGVIKFLAGDESSYLTGQNIVIDGGRSII